MDTLEKQLNDLTGLTCLDNQSRHLPPCEVCLHCKNKQINDIKQFLKSFSEVFQTSVIPKDSHYIYLDKEIFLQKRVQLLAFLHKLNS